MDIVVMGSNEKKSHAAVKRSHAIRGGLVHAEAAYLIDNNDLYQGIALRAEPPTTTSYRQPIFTGTTSADGEPLMRNVPLTVSTLAETGAPGDDEALAIGAQRLRVQVVLPSDVRPDRDGMLCRWYWLVRIDVVVSF
jgi:hypothetical protein